MVKKIFTFILSFTFLYVLPLNVFASENTYTQISKGVDSTDNTIINNAEQFLNSVVSGEKDLFYDGETDNAQPFTLNEADEEAINIINQRLENEKDEIKDVSELESTELRSFDMNNLKKVYPVSGEALKNIDDIVNIDSLILSDDIYFLDIPCVNADGIESIVSLNPNGDTANTLAYDLSVMSNEEIIELVMPYLDNEETIEDIKYMYSVILCPFDIAVIKTSNNREFIVSYSEAGEECGLTKGNVYTDDDFIEIIKEYDFPEASGELYAGHGTPTKNAEPKSFNIASFLKELFAVVVSKVI